MSAGSFHSFAPSHASGGGNFAHSGNFAGRGGNFARGADNFAGRYGNNFAGRYGNNFGGRNGNNFAGRYGNSYGHHQWDNYFARGGWGWGGHGWGWSGYSPWYSGLGWGWGYPYDYGYSYYPNFGNYYYSYAPTGYGDDYYNPYASLGYNNTGVVADSGVTAPQQFADLSPRPLPDPSLTPPAIAEGQPQEATGAMEYYSEARTAFLDGDYQNAMRLAGHAGLDAPQNPKVHELISLALFALGNYPAAANEAHAAMALGTIADWKDLYAYYNDANKYTTQLRALEKAAMDNPSSAAEHFLLGYHYLMIGARENANTELARAVKLAPNDDLAGRYLEQLRSNSPLTPLLIATGPQGKSL